MKFIAGLGNPEARYVGTAHNLGFAIVEVLARRWGWSWRLQERMRALTAEGQFAERPVLLVKPLTYMNRSGEALELLTRQRELASEDLLVVADDVNLPVGRVRIRSNGGHGGHNGLRSIIEWLGRDDFARLRIGIRTDEPIEELADYVLRKLPPGPRRQLEEMCEVAADAVECWLRDGAMVAADRFNGLPRDSPPDPRPNG
jgi:PTH1 family peptidyl-tRNA hydrolase